MGHPLEKYMHGQVSPDSDEVLAEGKGLNAEHAKAASREIQRATLAREENLFKAVLSAEKKNFLLADANKTIAGIQNELKVLDNVGGETKNTLKQKMFEELKFSLDEINGFEDPDIDKIRTKLQTQIDYISSL